MRGCCFEGQTLTARADGRLRRRPPCSTLFFTAKPWYKPTPSPSKRSSASCCFALRASIPPTSTTARVLCILFYPNGTRNITFTCRGKAIVTILNRGPCALWVSMNSMGDGKYFVILLCTTVGSLARMALFSATVAYTGRTHTQPSSPRLLYVVYTSTHQQQHSVLARPPYVAPTTSHAFSDPRAALTTSDG